MRVLLCEEQVMNRVRPMATAMECFCISKYSGYALGGIGLVAVVSFLSLVGFCFGAFTRASAHSEMGSHKSVNLSGFAG